MELGAFRTEIHGAGLMVHSDWLISTPIDKKLSLTGEGGSLILLCTILARYP